MTLTAMETLTGAEALELLAAFAPRPGETSGEWSTRTKGAAGALSWFLWDQSRPAYGGVWEHFNSDIDEEDIRWSL